MLTFRLVLFRSIAIVECQVQVLSRSAHPPRGKAGDIAELLDRLHPALAHLRADIGFVVDDARHGLQRHTGLGGAMPDRDGLARRAAHWLILWFRDGYGAGAGQCLASNASSAGKVATNPATASAIPPRPSSTSPAAQLRRAAWRGKR